MPPAHASQPGDLATTSSELRSARRSASSNSRSLQAPPQPCQQPVRSKFTVHQFSGVCCARACACEEALIGDCPAPPRQPTRLSRSPPPAPSTRRSPPVEAQPALPEALGGTSGQPAPQRRERTGDCRRGRPGVPRASTGLPAALDGRGSKSPAGYRGDHSAGAWH